MGESVTNSSPNSARYHHYIVRVYILNFHHCTDHILPAIDSILCHNINKKTMTSVVNLRIIDRISTRILEFINDYYNLREIDRVQLYFDEVYEEKREIILQDLQSDLRYRPELIRHIYQSQSGSIYCRVREKYESN